MDFLSSIRKPIKEELQAFECLFKEIPRTQSVILDRGLHHVLNRNGKMMRPMLVLLCAKNYGLVNDAVLHAAVSLEMLHTASLVHDDVVDESLLRRSQSSVNALLGNKAAVLIGDYMLSTALQHAAKTNDLRVVESVAMLGKTLSNGELLQLSNLQTDVVNETQYFEVIKNKTASLFSVSAYVGAMLAGADESEQMRVKKFGEYIGLCFQIRDDIFDYFDDEVGKPTGNDMQEGKLTLPLIHALEISTEKDWFDKAMKVRRGCASKEEMAALTRFAKTSGGIEYARMKMVQLRNDAVELLCDFNTEIREALTLYMDYVLNRVV